MANKYWLKNERWKTLGYSFAEEFASLHLANSFGDIRLNIYVTILDLIVDRDLKWKQYIESLLGKNLEILLFAWEFVAVCI